MSTWIINDCGVHCQMVINDDVEVVARQVADEVEEAAIATVFWLQLSTTRQTSTYAVPMHKLPEEKLKHR